MSNRELNFRNEVTILKSALESALDVMKAEGVAQKNPYTMRYFREALERAEYIHSNCDNDPYDVASRLTYSGMEPSVDF